MCGCKKSRFIKEREAREFPNPFKFLCNVVN